MKHSSCVKCAFKSIGMLLAVLCTQVSNATPEVSESWVFKPSQLLSEQRKIALPAKTYGLSSIGLLDIEESEKDHWFLLTPHHRDAYAISSDGKWLAFGWNNDGTKAGISVWNLETLEQSYVLEDKSFTSIDPRFSVYSHFIPNTNLLVTTSLVNTNALCPNCRSITSVWDVEEGKRLSAIGSEDIVNGHYVDSKGNIHRLQRFGQIEIWDSQSARQVGRLPPVTSSVDSVWQISGNSADTFASVVEQWRAIDGEYSPESMRHWLGIYSLQAKQLKHRIYFKSNGFRAVFIDQIRLATMTKFGELSIWDTQSGKKISTWNPASGHRIWNSPGNWLVHNGENLLATGLETQGALQLWDTRTGKKTKTLDTCKLAKVDATETNHKGSTYPVAFHKDTLVTISSCSQTIQVWDVSSGQIRGMLRMEGIYGHWSRVQLPDQLTTTSSYPDVTDKPEGFCKNFVETARKARQEAALLECEPKGISWHHDASLVNKWCEIHPQDEAEEVLKTYEEILGTCLRDGLLGDTLRGEHHKVASWLAKAASSKFIPQDANNNDLVLYNLMCVGFETARRSAFIGAMRALLESPRDLATTFCDGCVGTTIGCAVELKDPEVLGILLTEGKADIRELDASEVSKADFEIPIQIAIRYEDYASVDILLNHGASPDNSIRPQDNPLLQALQDGLVKIASRLLQAGAKANVGSEGICKGEMPLTLARKVDSKKEGIKELITLISERQKQHCPSISN